ncbi:MAG TPA: thiamine pyrophosphate-dependent enzyme [Capillimicrobium sp.]|nr:thiamine pyrophosphate-dependent enzyme [Capillimicrobium sp.]
MTLIRLFEQESERQYKRARIGGYCHLAIGQEAATVGAVAAMGPEDLLLSSYRSHGLALAKGVPATTVMAELFGRQDGCAAGRGGSMHLLDPAHNYFGGWGIVAGQLPIAAGMALAGVKEGKELAVLCELGDGAVNMGAWHEALNLAAVWKLPVVFAVFNNGYGMGTSVEQSNAEPEIYKRAAAFRMPGERVDGQDVEATHQATYALLERARTERQPAVLEVMTYRLRGHSVADAGTAYRTKEEVAEWAEKRDPIAMVTEKLIAAGATNEELDEIERDAQREVDEAVAFAEASPMPDPSTLAEFVYGDPDTGRQFSRMGPGSPAGEAAVLAQLEQAA